MMRERTMGFVACLALGALWVHAEQQGWQGYAEDREKLVAHKGTIPPPPADAPYRDAALDVEKRIDDLLPRLTDMEKVHLLHATGGLSMGNIARIGLCAFRTPDAGNGPRAKDRPGITYFPAPIGYAATFDRALVREVGRVMGEETRGVYPRALEGNGVGRILLGPGANIARTPVCARNFEYFGEDPRLAGETAAAWIAGLQSVKVAPCMKHYCFNEQEYSRQLVDVDCPERAVREIYTRPWEIAIRKVDPWAFMNSYNKFRGQWTSHSAYLNDMLAKEYGATGAFVPDWGGTHGFAAAVNGGTTIESACGENEARDRENLKELKEGKIDAARFNESLRRALRLYFRIGAFDQDSPADKALQERCEAAFHSPEHQAVARRTAEESVVLVKNESAFLPLTRAHLKIAVVGPYADRCHAMTEADTFLSFYGGAAAVKAAQEISPLQGFRRIFGAQNILSGADAVGLAKQADVVVFCGGIDHTYDSEAGGPNHVEPNDRRNIFLEAENGVSQEDTIRAIAAANANLVVILNGGAPVSVEEWHERAKAILVNWYGGEFNGEVLAQLVRGDVNPSGRLPYTYGKTLHDWPSMRFGEKCYPGERAIDRAGPGHWSRKPPQEYYCDGIWVGYRGFDKFKTGVRYPFGHGLSYTTFALANQRIEKTAQGYVVTARLTNTGARQGRRAVLCWARKPAQPDEPMPEKELVDFASVTLAPGASADLRFDLGFEELKYWNTARHAWEMPVGDCRFFLD